MLVYLRRSIVLMVVSFLVLGLGYAFAGTGVAQLLFPRQADGSLSANGSSLIGQDWTSTHWFHGRPDGFGPYASHDGSSPGDDPLVENGVAGESGATNFGPRSKMLVKDTRELIDWWHAHGVDPTTDLVTTSGSGLDPDISVRSALVQIPMVAAASHVSQAVLRTLIRQGTTPDQFGFLGSSYVDVLNLNVALSHYEQSHR